MTRIANRIPWRLTATLLTALSVMASCGAGNASHGWI